MCVSVSVCVSVCMCACMCLCMFLFRKNNDVYTQLKLTSGFGQIQELSYIIPEGSKAVVPVKDAFYILCTCNYS